MPDIITVKINPKPAQKYNIFVGSGVFYNELLWIPELTTISDIVIITDTAVNKIYAASLLEKITKHGYKALLFTVDCGEDSKSNKVKEHLELQMQQYKCDRKTLLIALGGGVIGDLTGFLAATYMRGIKFIQIPTTLLSMLDSSVGGKTGINTIYGKNLIGAIWQPVAVVTDIKLLATLPQIHLVNGLIEAIKIFLTSDAKSFNYLHKNLAKILKRDEKILQSIVKRAVKLKASVVEQDEREENLRMILNFGHTIGHAIEKSANYEILHGLCVALGILVEAKIAVILNHLSEDNFIVIKELLDKIGINQEMLARFSVDELIQNMLIDKKNSNGKIFVILINKIGGIYTRQDKVAIPITQEIIRQAFRELSIL